MVVKASFNLINFQFFEYPCRFAIAMKCIFFSVNIASNSIEKGLNLFVVLWLFNQIRYCNFVKIKKIVFNKILNLLVWQLWINTKYFIARTYCTVNHELELHLLKILNLIEVENIEKNWNKYFCTSYFILKFCIWKYSDPWKKL